MESDEFFRAYFAKFMAPDVFFNPQVPTALEDVDEAVNAKLCLCK